MKRNLERYIKYQERLAAFRSVEKSLTLASARSYETSPPHPPIFVSIDLEYDQHHISEVGISTFDPRTLLCPDLNSLISKGWPIDTTWYVVSNPKYRRRKGHKPSHYGKKRYLLPHEVRFVIERALTCTDEKGVLREIVLVGHGFDSDITTLKQHCAGFDICDVPNVKAVLDTQQVAHQVLDTTKHFNLRGLMRTLGLEGNDFHNAAHDSRYTLRALLLMCCRYRLSTPDVLSHEVLYRIGMIEEISRFHLSREIPSWSASPIEDGWFGNSDLRDFGLIDPALVGIPAFYPAHIDSVLFDIPVFDPAHIDPVLVDGDSIESVPSFA